MAREGFQERSGIQCSRKYLNNMWTNWGCRLRDDLTAAAAAAPQPDFLLNASDDAKEVSGSAPTGKKAAEVEAASGSVKKVAATGYSTVISVFKHARI